MKCRTCSAEVVVAGAFPGARIRCVCGTEIVVTAAQSAESGPYRAAAIVPPIHSAPVEEARLEGPAPKRVRACPRCKASLDAEPIATCAGCGGAFVEHSALDEALARRVSSIEIAVPTQPVSADAVLYLSCPDCTVRMSRSLFGKRSGVVVDICAKHGTWFDAAELGRAAQHAAMHGRSPIPSISARRPPAKGGAEAAELKVALLTEGHHDDLETRAIVRHTRRGSLLEILIDWISSD